jgi:hypothetical protein
LSAATPLFYYVLMEEELMEDGLRLGPMGGTIVGEVFINCLRNDPNSYFTAQPNWKPAIENAGSSFRMTHFLKYAGVDPASRGQ